MTKNEEAGDDGHPHRRSELLYLFDGRYRTPPEVIQKAKHHILDTLAAMVSGSKLKPGQLAIEYVKRQAGAEEAQIAGSRVVSSAINAAFANGMMAHADETDDSNARSRMHPGCSIVPAALAMAERQRADGTRFLKGVVAGYDIGCRMTQALGAGELRQASLSSHSIGGNFGAVQRLPPCADWMNIRSDTCYRMRHSRPRV